MLHYNKAMNLWTDGVPTLHTLTEVKNKQDFGEVHNKE